MTRGKQLLDKDSKSFVVCKNCGGYYKLREGESLEDFESCQCGGDLEAINNNYDTGKGLYQIRDADNGLFQTPEIGDYNNHYGFLIELMEKINYKAILIGSIVVIFLSLAIITINSGVIISFIWFNPQFSNYIPFAFFSALITGYISGKNWKSGVINGVISGLITTITIYLLLVLSPNDDILTILMNVPTPVSYYVLTNIITILTSALAGSLGVYLKKIVNPLK